MRLLIVSDTHLNNPENIPLPFGEADAAVHAGDFVSREVYEKFDSRATLHAVHGNADSTAVREELPERTSFVADGVHVAVIHGHRLGHDEVGYVGAEEGAHLVVRGHTHKPSYKERGLPVLNPGSPTRPRSSPPSYAWLVCSDGRYGGRIMTLADEVLEEFGDIEVLEEL